MKETYTKSWEYVFQRAEEENIYVKQHRIPLGARKPFFEYKEEVPEEEILYINFDDVNIPFTARKPFNILILGGSGDHKSLVMKNIWFILHEAGYFCLYIDPKCVSGESKVLLSNGNYEKIKNLPTEGYLISINKKLKNEVKKYKVISKSVPMECYKIKTSFGEEIICSNEHKFMSAKNEWKKLEELKSGDFIALTRNIPYFKNDFFEKEKVKIIAYLIAEGGLTMMKYGNIRFTNMEEIIVRDLNDSLKIFKNKLVKIGKRNGQFRVVMEKKCTYPNKNSLRIFLEELELFGKSSNNKNIPVIIFKLSKENIALFLNRIFSCDGTIFRKNNGKNRYRYTIKYVSNNEKLCLDLKHLLLRFGIIGKVYREMSKKYKTFHYIFEIQNSIMVKKFIDEINFYGIKKEKAEIWYEDIIKLEKNCNCKYDKLPLFKWGRFQTRKNYRNLVNYRNKIDEDLAYSDIFWDRIKLITKEKIMDTYDLIVEDNENYICNNFIVHNSTDSGRARKSWANERTAPKLKPKGIKLRHYIPSFAIRNFGHLIHNFRIYSLRLTDLYEKEMWMGLGIPKIGAYKIASIIQNKKDVSLDIIRRELMEMKYEKEIQQQSISSALSVLVDLEDFGFVSNRFKEIDLFDDWYKGYSVCISYNSAGISYLSFDVGEKVNRSAQYYFNRENRNPIMIFFDDAGYYAQEKSQILKTGNFAVQEIENIGNNYRSLGVYNCLAAQSLKIIDNKIAETYKIKIITPTFAHPESLRDINIPEEVIFLLQNAGKPEGLYTDRINHIFEYILIDEHNNWHRFFPFFPPVNHFSEVYNVK